MKTFATFAAALVVGLAVAAAANGAPNTATTTLSSDTPSTGTTLDVTFTVYGDVPVVPYEYAIKNTCLTPGAKGGGYTIGQTDPIVTWTDQGPNGEPRTTMPVYLESVPSGSSCRVSLVKNNTVVKGSTLAYTVGP
jgi:hypothetical protein